MDFKNKIKQELINEDIHLSLTNEQRESIADLTDYQLRLYVVNYRRELLKGFVKYITPALEIDIGFDYLGDDEINDYIETL